MLTDVPILETLAPDIGAFSFRDESILGTRLQLLLVARSYAAAHEAAMAARAEIDRLNSIFNTRQVDSELSRLNRAARFHASAELFAVVALAERWRAASFGAFSGRMGRVIDAWQSAAEHPPSRVRVLRLAEEAARGSVQLDADTRTIQRPAEVRFALDGIAKGWIVDRAFSIAMSYPGVTGALVDIGGDIRAGGASPGNSGWLVGIPDPLLPFDNSPIRAFVRLLDGAIATSGRGPRDRRIANATYSPTLSPQDGWSTAHHSSVSVIARTAADADALATALLVLPTSDAFQVARTQSTAARITTIDGTVHETAPRAPGSSAFMANEVTRNASRPSATTDWQEGWQALATFTAPRRQLIRDPQFRSPYMAMWITDRDNRPIRTLILVGKRADWQKDNFIWWSMNREKTERLVSTRSMSTSGAGVYNVFWDGVNDAGEVVPAGTYVLHVETSRERGQHTYRSLTLDFGKFQRFTAELPPTEEGGGLRVSFDHY